MIPTFSPGSHCRHDFCGVFFNFSIIPRNGENFTTLYLTQTLRRDSQLTGFINVISNLSVLKKRLINCAFIVILNSNLNKNLLKFMFSWPSCKWFSRKFIFPSNIFFFWGRWVIKAGRLKFFYIPYVILTSCPPLPRDSTNRMQQLLTPAITRLSFATGRWISCHSQLMIAAVVSAFADRSYLFLGIQSQSTIAHDPLGLIIAHPHGFKYRCTQVLTFHSTQMQGHYTALMPD